MKRNEQLFDIMGDIPDKYVEDAIKNNAITEKKTSVRRIVRTIAACAAVFTAVCAVPVAVIIMNSRTGNDPDVVPVTTEVTEVTTAETTEDEPENTDENEQINDGTRLSFGTGPKRPENYTPDRKYSCCNIANYRLVNEFATETTMDIPTYLKTILVNESYADEIVSDYTSRTEKYIETLGLKEGDYGLDYYICDYDCYSLIVNENKYVSCINGFIEIYANINYNENSDHKILSFVYDLVEEKTVDNISDLFYYGEDYYNEIMTNLDLVGEDKDSVKLEDIMMYCVPLFSNNDESWSGVKFYGYNDWIYDISVIGRYRDLMGVIKDEYLAESEYDEWYNYFSDVAVDGFTVKMYSDGSRYHSESEINSKNSKRQERCGVVLDYLKEHHYLDNYDEKNLEMIIAFDDLAFEVYGHDRSEFLGVFKFDTEKEKVLPADTNIPEWRNYVKGYFTGDDYDHLNTDMSFDLNNCDLQNYLWLRFYYISEEAVNRGNVPDTDYSVVLSNEEIENLNDVALAVKAYNRDTLEQINLLVVIPFEKIDDPNYTKDNFLDEPYAEKIIFCDK